MSIVLSLSLISFLLQLYAAGEMRPDVYCYSHELRWRQLWRDAGGNVGQFCDKLKAHRGARPMPSALSVARALVGVSPSSVAVVAATAADVCQSIRRFIPSSSSSLFIDF